jgi:hypothetical protein
MQRQCTALLARFACSSLSQSIHEWQKLYLAIILYLASDFDQFSMSKYILSMSIVNLSGRRFFRDGAVGACVRFSSPRINIKSSSRSSDHFLLPSDRDGGRGRISHFIWLMGTDTYFIREEVSLFITSHDLPTRSIAFSIDSMTISLAVWSWREAIEKLQKSLQFGLPNTVNTSFATMLLYKYIVFVVINHGGGRSAVFP